MDAVAEAVPIHSAPRRILAVFNPAAGRKRRPHFDRVIAALRNMGCGVVVLETEAPGHAEAIARSTPEADYDLIAAAGGDGTVNEIVNGLRGKVLALGVIPLGTANVLADEIGLGRKAGKIAHALAFGPLKPIRVGVANGRRFVMMAGAGFDADVVDRVSLPLKKLLGPFAYVWQTMRQAFGAAVPDCDVTVDGIAYRAASAVVCNGRHYGGPFVAAPKASLAEDQFQIVLMAGRGWRDVLRYGVALLMGRLSALSDVKLVAGRSVVVRGRGGAPMQADGDIVTALPAHINVDPESVWLAYPA